MILQFSSYIKKISTLPDRTLKLTIETQELPPDDMAKIFDLMDKYCWLALKEQEAGAITEDELDIPEVDKIEKDAKTPSQRLRNVIYIFYLQQNKGKEDFDTFYRRNVEKIIDRIKNELE